MVAFPHPVTSSVTISSTVPADVRSWAARFDRVHIDLGTGDGAFAVALARERYDLAVIGLDTCLDHLAGSPLRRPGNVRFVPLDALGWPLGSLPAAEAVTINFPYGSLLRGLVAGDAGLIARLDSLVGPGSRIEVRINASALLATRLDPEAGPGDIVRVLRQIDRLRVTSRALSQAELRAFPTTWSKRLGYGRPTMAHLITADCFVP